MDYEWDPDKAAANLRKHEVDFADAALALEDPLAMTMPDPDAVGEERSVTIGAKVTYCHMRSGRRSSVRRSIVSPEYGLRSSTALPRRISTWVAERLGSARNVMVCPTIEAASALATISRTSVLCARTNRSVSETNSDVAAIRSSKVA